MTLVLNSSMLLYWSVTGVVSVFSPSAMSYEDTYNTLKYADRAKNIKANVSIAKNCYFIDFHFNCQNIVISNDFGRVMYFYVY